ncbi:MAG: Tetratricopeptide 2 repeat protein [Pedosphaera sp.]|nr:Tetratricopeptide 2 repeat protein [Pedosphaera sp.]
MKRFLILALLFLLTLAPGAWAEGPDDQYVGIYNLIQQADALNEKGQWAAAMAKYVEVQSALKRFQAGYPDWNVKVVHYRLNYVAVKMAQISSRPPASVSITNAPAAPATNVPVAAPTPTPAPAPATNEVANPPVSMVTPTLPVPTEAENQVRALQDQVRRMEADKVLLESKLKEALAAQPAATDPRELAKAEGTIRELQKENELLRVSLAQVKTNVLPANPAVLEQTQQSLAEANRKVTQLTEANAALVLDKAALQSRVKTLAAPDEATVALRAENEILKKQVTDLKSKGAVASKGENLSRQLLEAQAQVAALQSDKEILRLERIALENRVKQSIALHEATPVKAPVTPAAAPVVDVVSKAKIKQLETQRDELQKTLNAATRELQGKAKGKETADRIEEMTRQLAALRARIEVFEARQVPYSAEELALFSLPQNTLVASAHVSARKRVKDLPAEAAVLVADAQRFFVAGEYDKAEEKYLEVLKLDDKNVPALGNLATIQMQLNHLEEAEAHIKQAIAVDPADAYSLLVLGQLKFQQRKFDEALDALSRAAQLDPQNARIQNFLGITLSEKGMRGPAETALRKAIQIDPGYGDAQSNLAVVYVAQQPPLMELARWHYQKALAVGHPRILELEKLLEDPKAATTTQ